MEIDRSAPLVVGAMPSELRHPIEAGSQPARRQIGPWVHWCVTLGEQRVNLLLTGIGMVNAGAALARALCELQPEIVLNYGCSGAHRDDIHPGDVVIGTRYVHHRAVTILPEGGEQYSGTPIAPEDSSAFVDGFDADPDVLTLANAASDGWRPDPWKGPGGPQSPSVHSGPIASADAWTQSLALINEIHERHGTLCEDMEAAALAQIASMHRVPFLAIKDISNNEFHSATDLGEYGGPTLQAVEQQVGKRAFELVRRILERRAA